VVLPAAHLHATRPLVVRFGALHIDETGQRLCAVAAALRPSQDFDLFDVEQRGDSPDTAEVDVIDDETDGRVRCTLVLLQFARATNLEIAFATYGHGPVQVRHEEPRLLEMLHGQLLDGVGVENGDACSHLIRGTLTEIGGDDDFLECFAGGCARDGGEQKDNGAVSEYASLPGYRVEHGRILFLRRYYPVQVLRVPG